VPGAIASGARARAASSTARWSARLWSSGLPGRKPNWPASRPSAEIGAAGAAMIGEAAVLAAAAAVKAKKWRRSICMAHGLR
jgi:hypothetical protein